MILKPYISPSLRHLVFFLQLRNELTELMIVYEILMGSMRENQETTLVDKILALRLITLCSNHARQ
jgi:hypothetical protein